MYMVQKKYIIMTLWTHNLLGNCCMLEKRKDLPNESDSIIILLSNPKAMHILPPSFLQMLAF